MIESYREFVTEAIGIVCTAWVLLIVTIGPVALIAVAIKDYKERRK
jgi:hypothetical protein